jgi:hypothetical protein
VIKLKENPHADRPDDLSNLAIVVEGLGNGGLSLSGAHRCEDRRRNELYAAAIEPSVGPEERGLTIPKRKYGGRLEHSNHRSFTRTQGRSMFRACLPLPSNTKGDPGATNV